MNNTATNSTPCPTVRKQIGKTTYIVRVHFSETAKETMEDKIKRLLREEVRKMWLLFEFDEKVLDFSSLEVLTKSVLSTVWAGDKISSSFFYMKYIFHQHIKVLWYATNITGEIAAYAYQIFKENYNWSKPIRSVGVRGADLVTDNYWEQIDLFSSVEKQQNVYESIMQYQRVNGYAPAIREICKMVGVASTSSVYAHLKILEEKGYIARKMDASRAIAIL